MKLFAFAASLRQGSLNRRLVSYAATVAQELGAEEVTLVDFQDLVSPDYSGDFDGFPEGAERFRDLMTSHDGFLLASPEYNYSFPGSLKNAFDWLSRFRPVPTQGKKAYLLSASPGAVGGNRGLWHLRQPLTCVGLDVYSGMFSLANAGSAFHEDGSLSDADADARLRQDLGGFLGGQAGADTFK